MESVTGPRSVPSLGGGGGGCVVVVVSTGVVVVVASVVEVSVGVGWFRGVVGRGGFGGRVHRHHRVGRGGCLPGGKGFGGVAATGTCRNGK